MLFSGKLVACRQKAVEDSESDREKSVTETSIKMSQKDRLQVRIQELEEKVSKQKKIIDSMCFACKKRLIKWWTKFQFSGLISNKSRILWYITDSLTFLVASGRVNFFQNEKVYGNPKSFKGSARWDEIFHCDFISVIKGFKQIFLVYYSSHTTLESSYPCHFLTFETNSSKSQFLSVITLGWST